VTDYEILLLLDPELAEEKQAEAVDRLRGLIEQGGGTFERHDPWGRRKLAYPIDKKEDGSYHLLTFSANAETLDEIGRVLKIDDAVMRHMATKHIEGSRTSAPRDDTPVPAPVSAPAPAAVEAAAPAAVATVEEPDAETAPVDDETSADEEE
jgi:small subunit ribosomal protein S6